MWATNAKIVGIVLGTLALYTLIANKIPQVQSEVPQALTLGANVTPEQLSPEQVWSVIAFLESQGGTVDVSADDVAKSKPAAGGLSPGASPGNTGGAFAGGSTDPKAIIQAAGCLVCHKLEGQGQVIAPDLTHVGSRRDAESIRKKILDPASSVTKGYEKLAGIMPKSFGTMMNAAQLEALAQYLAAHK